MYRACYSFCEKDAWKALRMLISSLGKVDKGLRWMYSVIFWRRGKGCREMVVTGISIMGRLTILT